MQCKLCYSRCIALHFQPLQHVHLTAQWLIFYETKMKYLIGKHLFSSANNKKGKHGKCSVKVHIEKYNTWYTKGIYF